MRRALLASFVLLAATAGPSGADGLAVPDPNDSPGRLDIRSIRHGHHVIQSSGQRLIRHRIRTFEGWRTRVLAGGSTWISLFFDLDADDEPDRRLTIDTYEGTLSAEMDDPNEGGRIYGYAQVWRPDRETIAVQFPPRLLGPDPFPYDWYAETIFNAPNHPSCGNVGDVSVLCHDRAPESDAITHEAA